MFLTHTVSYTLHNPIATTIPKPEQDKNTEQLLYNTNPTSDELIFLAIAVGGGGAGGAVAPPFGSKRRKSSKIWANGLIYLGK